MRGLIALLLCCYFSVCNAQSSSREPMPRDENRSSQNNDRIERSSITPPTPPVEPASVKAIPVITGVTGECVQPGDILSFTGENLFSLSGTLPLLTLGEGDAAIHLKPLSLTNTRITVQVFSDQALQPNSTYPVYLLEPEKTNSYQKTNLTIRTCFFKSQFFKEKSSPQYEMGEILILTDEQQAFTVRKNIIKSGYKILRENVLSGLDKTLFVLSVQEQLINNVIISLRQQYPNVKIDLNHHYQPVASPRTYASNQIAWPDSKALCHSDYYKNINIGIIDSYVDQNHPVLAGQNITVKNFLKKTEQADARHGTAISAILTGDKPELGFQGLLPGITIMAASVIRQDNESLVATTESLVRSLNWLIVENVRLINISLSGASANSILKHTFQIGIEKGLIIFAAAGNQGPDSRPSFPAALPEVIAVTAIDVAFREYAKANHGQYIDFSAPGVDIWTVDKELQGKYRSGTSYAAPHALAIAALYLARNPSLSRDILYNSMQADTHDLGITGHDAIFGWGLIQTPKKICRN